MKCFIGKKAQGWGLDLFLAITVFIAGLLFFYIYTINNPFESESMLSDMKLDADIASEILLSKGYPEGWIEGNVLTPGLLDDGKINNTKLEILYNLSNSDYQRFKTLFSTTNELYINSTDKFSFPGGDVQGIGNIPVDPENLVVLDRIAPYEGKISRIEVIIWN